MRKISKVLLVLLVLVIMTASFYGCGNNGSTQETTGITTTGAETTKAETTAVKEKQKLTLMSWGGTENETKTTSAVFNAYPELADSMSIEVVVGGKTDADVANKLRLTLAANEELPNIVMLNYIQVPEFAAAGVLEDISETVEPYKSDIIPGILNIMSYKDQMVAFPYDAKSKIWFYRKDMFDAAGINANEVKNIDDIITAGKKLQEKYPKSYIWNLFSSSRAYDVGSMLTGFHSVFSDNSGAYTVDKDPGVRETFEAFKKLKDSGVTCNINDFTPDWEKSLADGTLASEFIAGWFKVFLPNYAPDTAGKWAAAPWPAELSDGSPQGGAVFVVPSGSKNKELTKEFLVKMRLDKKGSIAVYKAFTITPVLLSCADDPALNEAIPFFGFSTVPVEFETYKNFSVFPYTPTSSQEFPIVIQYLDKYMNNEMDLDSALSGAQKDLTSTVSK